MAASQAGCLPKMVFRAHVAACRDKEHEYSALIAQFGSDGKGRKNLVALFHSLVSCAGCSAAFQLAIQAFPDVLAARKRAMRQQSCP